MLSLLQILLYTVIYGSNTMFIKGMFMDNTNYEKRGYLTCDFRLFHLTDVPSQEFQFHYHDFDKIIIFLSGHVDYTIEGQTYQLMPYDIVLVRHGEIHCPHIDQSFHQV